MYENVTITIGEILESYSFPNVIPHDKPWDSMSVDQIVEAGKDGFFDFTFPWYSPSNTGLEDFKDLFLRKFYMEQIGQETTAQFKLYMQARLMEKMPLYSQLWESTQYEYDPLVNRKLTTTIKENEGESRDKNRQANGTTDVHGTGNSSSESTENDTTNNQAVHSENPEVSVATKDYAATMDRGKSTKNNTANTDTNVTDSSTSTGQTTENESEDIYRKHESGEEVVGFYGESQADAILKYRETILNINQMICEDMKDLFLGWYGGVKYGLNW